MKLLKIRETKTSDISRAFQIELILNQKLRIFWSFPDVVVHEFATFSTRPLAAH